MRNLKGLLAISVVLLLVSCTMSAKTGEKQAEKATTAEVVHLNKTEFLSKVFDFEKSPNKWVYEGDKPCIIDFYADWCGPCKKVAPILNELAETYKNDIVIYKVNVDKEKELASAFGIQSIPTFLFIPMNGQPQVAQGALPKEAFVEQINSFLLGKKK
ncbi:thioredoxin [Parabacteroides chinchillae]|uniref:Thioredoxin n=1 Tax=Parabacteroides chinchillae TaxID=871327 RepID=A0A8G2BXA9_9BACT|nr:thioredoxin [Parabacteroides chinchillae]SEG01850.1 thioredoxin [Parabacteroides chinchillae]